MAGANHQSESGWMPGPLSAVVRGQADTRPRATWRVLLATPVLWILTGDVLTANLMGVIGGVVNRVGEGLTASLLHGIFLVLVLAIWARYLDRQPLSNYGLSASPDWWRDLVGGFLAIGLVTGVWHALGVAMGWTEIQLTLSATDEPLLLGLGTFTIALGIHAAIQQVVFFRVIPKNAAEGLYSRGLNPPRAVLAGILVTLPFFLSIHELFPTLRIVDLLLVGLVFGLLYAQTGDLALGIGLHTGIFVVTFVIFAPAAGQGLGPTVFEVAQSLPAVLGVIPEYGFPNVIAAYLVLVGWLYWRRGEVAIRREIAARRGG